MAKQKTEKAKELLNPPPEEPQRTTAAEITAMKKEWETWRESTYKACMKEVENLQKGYFEQYFGWQKKKPSKLKDC